MKIITWNCQGAFREKANVILEFEPDILCMQEIELPSRINFSSHKKQPNSVIRCGETDHKGAAVLTYNDVFLDEVSAYDKRFRHVLPVRCRQNDFSFVLFNIWTKDKKKDRSCGMEYIDHVLEAIPFYSGLGYEKSIFIGDYNADTIVTTRKRFEKAVSLFDSHGLNSAYHHYFGCELADEQHPTEYYQRDFEKPFHIDYAFCARYWIDRLVNVEVGKYDFWRRYSDHMPLMFTFDHKIN
ncbi:hypothetical protein [Desulfarculus baarsii]